MVAGRWRKGESEGAWLINMGEKLYVWRMWLGKGEKARMKGGWIYGRDKGIKTSSQKVYVHVRIVILTPSSSIEHAPAVHERARHTCRENVARAATMCCIWSLRTAMQDG